MIEQLPTPVGTPQPHPPETVVKSKKKSKSQSKPLLFINHDAKHLKPQATRSEITSHLRTAYQPWKHRMQARARRDASMSADHQKSSEQQRASGQVAFFERVEIDEFTSDGDSQTFSLVHGVDDLDEDSISQTPSPLFYQGNSDPFSALALKITPLIAELIKFEHAHLHPCIYSTKNAPSRAYGTSYLADMHGPAANQAAVYGYLSRAAIVLSSASLDPRFAQAALVLKGKSSALLRAQLASGDTSVQGDILRKILALMIAELFAHNYDAALIHSRILMGMLQERSEKDKFDMRFFFSVVYSEIQRSCMSLTRPCFDVSASGWVAQKFESVGGDAFKALISTLDVDEEPLEPSVLGLELAEIFGEVRTVRLVSQAYSTSALYGTPTPLALHLPARVVLCLGKLVRYYVDRCSGPLVSKLSPTDLIHRAAVLGALYWVRKAGHIDSIKVSSTSTIYSAGPLIIAKLRESLFRFDATASPAEEDLYKDLRFWILYIGAQEEQGRLGRGEFVEKWFTARLIMASAAINVYTWQQARPVLERYPHPDAAEPHGSTWFSAIFSGISTSSTCFGGIFARSGSAKSSNANLPSNLYGTADDVMTWSTDEPMAKEMSSTVNNDLTCAVLAPSTETKPTTFACPAWDIGQEDYWVSTQSKISTTPREDRCASLLNKTRAAASEAKPVAFALFSDVEMAQYIASQETQDKLAAGISSIDETDDTITKWLDEQSVTSTPPQAALAYRSWDMLPESHSFSLPNDNISSAYTQSSPPKSHIYEPSSQCWHTGRCSDPSHKEMHGYTSRMNDSKLTGIETGPVAFATYPERKMDDSEAVAEARKYEFF